MNPTNMMTSRRDDLLRRANMFFSVRTNFEALHSILSKKKLISLRTLEFTVINFTKFVPNSLKMNGNYQVFLDSHGKRFFDAFRRHEKFNYTYEDKVNGDLMVATNVAQLRFLKFVIENQIHIWLSVKKNRTLIEKSMRSKERKIMKRRSKDGCRIRKKRFISVVVKSNKEVINSIKTDKAHRKRV